MDTPDLERLTLLERAQLLHDATLRRHGEMLDRLDEARVQHDLRLGALRQLAERQERLLETLGTLLVDHTTRLESLTTLGAQHDLHLATLTAIAAQHDERMAAVQQTLAAIKDMLERGNGH